MIFLLNKSFTHNLQKHIYIKRGLKGIKIFSYIITNGNENYNLANIVNNIVVTLYGDYSFHAEH